MTSDWLSAQQPATYDYLRPNGFKLLIDGLPNVNYACQSVSLPGISLGTARTPTPFSDVPNVGDKLHFNEFSINFLLQEEMQNYLELFYWIQAIGFPDSYKQYRNLQNVAKNKRVLDKKSLETSDATLIVFSSENNPKLAIKFYDLYPTGINNVEFDIRTTDVPPITVSASFMYREYDFTI